MSKEYVITKQHQQNKKQKQKALAQWLQKVSEEEIDKDRQKRALGSPRWGRGFGFMVSARKTQKPYIYCLLSESYRLQYFLWLINLILYPALGTDITPPLCSCRL